MSTVKRSMAPSVRMGRIEDWAEDERPQRSAGGCAVEGCANVAQRSARYCDMHGQRGFRLGSPTALRCKVCKKIFDNEETALGEGHKWRCQDCTTVNKICSLEGCGKPLKGRRTTWCSHACWVRGSGRIYNTLRKIRKHGTHEPKPRKCKNPKCGVTFTPPAHSARRWLFCTRRCAWRHRHATKIATEPPTKTCLWCEVSFVPEPTPGRNYNKTRLCSKSCRKLYKNKCQRERWSKKRGSDAGQLRELREVAPVSPHAEGQVAAPEVV